MESPEVDATYKQRGLLDIGDEEFVGLSSYRRQSSNRLFAQIQEKPLPALPPIPPATPLPAGNFLAVVGFARKFLFDTSLPLHWRAHCFEALSRRYLLKKYKYPQPTWPYKLLKMMAPILKWPFQLIQKFK